MRKVVAAAVAAVALAGVARAAVPHTISQTQIGGAPLGKTHAWYRAHFGKPARLDMLENRYDRLVFSRYRLEVYFRTGRNGAVGILTSSKSFRTAEGVGPCSKIATLESAYGDRLHVFRDHGRAVAWRVGHLWFTKAGTRVGVVYLAGARTNVYVALSALACGSSAA